MTRQVSNRLKARIAAKRQSPQYNRCNHETHASLRKRRIGHERMVMAFVMAITCAFVGWAFHVELLAKAAELITGAAVYWRLFGLLE